MEKQKTIREDNIVASYQIEKDKNFFVLYYTKNEEIIIEHLNLSNLNKLYKLIFPAFHLTKEFNNQNGLETFKELKNELETGIFTLNELERQIKLKIKINNRTIIFKMNEIEEFSIFLEKIKLIISDLNKEKNVLEQKYRNLESDKKENNDINNLSNISKEKNQNFISINDYNELFWNSIDNKVTKILDLSFTQRGDEILGKLNNKKFDNLEELKLYTNKIININPLEKMNLEKLQILHLYNNYIKDISPLEKMNLIQLKQLYLQNNQISDISPLKNVKCFNLEYLYLNNNNIFDITSLSEVNFTDLKRLKLHKNHIKNINVFEYEIFKNLEVLSLCFNNIEDISVFNNVQFLKMKSLWLYRNNFKYNEKEEIIKKLKDSIYDFQ